MDKVQMNAPLDIERSLAPSNQWALARDGTTQGCLLGLMDPEIAQSFTDAQLRELDRILAIPSSKRLPIDIRITVPIL